MNLPTPSAPARSYTDTDTPATLARNISPAATGCTTTSADGVQHAASKPSCEMASEGAGGVIDNTSTKPHAATTSAHGPRPAAVPVAG